MLKSVRINSEPVLYSAIPALAERSARTVLMVRHSIRESLRALSIDPVLTPEGKELARRCGKLLSGLGDASFGASPRERTRDTARCLIEGGGFRTRDIRDCPEISDMTIFQHEVDFEAMLRTHNTENVMREYYATGHAEGLKDMRPFGAQILEFLTSDVFGTPCSVFVSHDVLAMAALAALGVRGFSNDDWCGFLHGILLTRDADGVWTAAYTLPDYDVGKKFRLFV